MSSYRSLLLFIAAGAIASVPTVLSAQELSPAEKTVSAELQRCPAQNAERCHTAALQQFETSLRREFSAPGAVYWAKVLAVLKRHAKPLDAEIRAAEKRATTGAASNAASGGSRMSACMAAGGTFAECYYWIVVLGGGR